MLPLQALLYWEFFDLEDHFLHLPPLSPAVTWAQCLWVKCLKSLRALSGFLQSLWVPWSETNPNSKGSCRFFLLSINMFTLQLSCCWFVYIAFKHEFFMLTYFLVTSWRNWKVLDLFCLSQAGEACIIVRFALSPNTFPLLTELHRAVSF